MSELIADCPRCKAQKMTFNLRYAELIDLRYDWQKCYEAFCACRNCNLTTTFVLSQKDHMYSEYIKRVGLLALAGSVNQYFNLDGFVSQKDSATVTPPEHLPENIKSVFLEGSKCLSIGCYNAASTMFRLCLDLSTKSLIQEKELPNLGAKVQRNLYHRLQWLFENHKLPATLKELSHCAREDGNDGAHFGTLDKTDAEDVLDFTIELLERIFTEPKRLEIAKKRREERRQLKAQNEATT